MHDFILQRLLAEDLPEGPFLVPTLSGEFVTVTKLLKEDDSTQITVTSSAGEAVVKTTDLDASNGVLHVVDSVL